MGTEGRTGAMRTALLVALAMVAAKVADVALGDPLASEGPVATAASNGTETEASIPAALLHVPRTGCFPRMYAGIHSIWTFPLLRLLQSQGYAEQISDAIRPVYRLEPELALQLQSWASQNRVSKARYDVDRNPVARQDTSLIAQLDWEAVWLGLAPRLTSSSHTEGAVRALQFILRVKMGLPVTVDGRYKNSTLHEILQSISRSNGAPVGEMGEVSSSLWRVILQCDCDVEKMKSPTTTPQDGYISGANSQKGITVKKATYGGNCGETEGNVNVPVAFQCDGKSECNFHVDRGQLGFDTSDVVLRASYLGKEMHRKWPEVSGSGMNRTDNGSSSSNNSATDGAVFRVPKMKLAMTPEAFEKDQARFTTDLADLMGLAASDLEMTLLNDKGTSSAFVQTHEEGEVEPSTVAVLLEESDTSSSIFVQVIIKGRDAATGASTLKQLADSKNEKLLKLGIDPSSIKVEKMASSATVTISAKKEGDLYTVGPVCEQQAVAAMCPKGTIVVVNAQYGRSSVKACPMPGHMDDLKCSAPDALAVVKSECEGRSSCRFVVDTAAFLEDPCPATFKRLMMSFKCDDGSLALNGNASASKANVSGSESDSSVSVQCPAPRMKPVAKTGQDCFSLAPSANASTKLFCDRDFMLGIGFDPLFKNFLQSNSYVVQDVYAPAKHAFAGHTEFAELTVPPDSEVLVTALVPVGDKSQHSHGQNDMPNEIDPAKGWIDGHPEFKESPC